MPCIPSVAAAALLLVASCTQVDVAWRAATDEGTVYDCKTHSGTVIEICYRDDAGDELGALLDASCGEPSRTWPWFADLVGMGCAYECPSRKGCNAKWGCYCP
jgi:hypothetical protein